MLYYDNSKPCIKINMACCADVSATAGYIHFNMWRMPHTEAPAEVAWLTQTYKIRCKAKWHGDKM